jgi:hypothetical protein
VDKSEIEHIKDSRILFSPLNWGWGHVSRSIPILKELSRNNNLLFLACDLEQFEVLTQYGIVGTHLSLKGYPFRFNGGGHFEWDILGNSLSLFKCHKLDRKKVESWVSEHHIDVTFSDHRYAIRSKKCLSILLTHQLSPIFKFAKVFFRTLHHLQLKHFDEIWLLDNKERFFSGELGRSNKSYSLRFVGPSSRFEESESTVSSLETLVLISGPEPYAEMFFREQYQRFSQSMVPVVFVLGGRNYEFEPLSNLTFVQSLDWKEIDLYLMSAKNLIARSGYSTIMDVFYLNCSAEWHPTKGQSEQEYLATKHKKSLR